MGSYGMADDFNSSIAIPSRFLSVDKQRNFWGQTTDLHRQDLWYVDFTQALKEIRSYFSIGVSVLPDVRPQHVQSIALPEVNEVRAEPTRRDSIPYPMPSWDEPLKPVVVTMLLDDTYPNPVLGMLERWMSLVRAGRGLRSDSGGSSGAFNAPTLNENFTIPFRFQIILYLLQGALGTTPPSSQVRATSSAVEASIKNTLTAKAADSIKVGGVPVVQALRIAKSAAEQIEVNYCALRSAKEWKAKVWLSGYKVSDLTYSADEPVLVTATFQTEHIRLEEAT